MKSGNFVKDLNEGLSMELGTIIKYSYLASKANGELGPQFRDMFLRAIQDNLRHATYLMDTIVNLGGEPTTSPYKFCTLNNLIDMVDVERIIEKDGVKFYQQKAKQAKEWGKEKLSSKFESMARDERSHVNELHSLLKEVKSKNIENFITVS